MDRTTSDFRSDRKWCPACDTYVPFLMSIDASFCVECGGEVRLFSKDDWERFEAKMEARKKRRGGRPAGRRIARRRDSA